MDFTGEGNSSNEEEEDVWGWIGDQFHSQTQVVANGVCFPTKLLVKAEHQPNTFINIHALHDTYFIFELYSMSRLGGDECITKRQVYGDFRGKISPDLRKYADENILKHMYKITSVSWPKATMRYGCAMKAEKDLVSANEFDANLVCRKLLALNAKDNVSRPNRLDTLAAIKEAVITKRKDTANEENAKWPMIEYVGIWLNVDEQARLIVGDDIYKKMDPLLLAINTFTSKEQMLKETNVTI